MQFNLIDKFWHKTLGRPYYLASPLDEGLGQPIVFLHGIGRTGKIWQHVFDELKNTPCRLVAFDLLGFGASSKPNWLEYTVDDHATAVINSIQKLGSETPVILVGHSMGCLVAVRVARRRPDLVKHLVLYQMPLLDGLPDKRRYRVQINLYTRFFKHIVAIQPTFNPETARLTERTARRIAGFEVTRESWQPFVKSLEHTIIEQTTADDIKHVSIPMDVIYGAYDMLVIRGKAKQIFGADTPYITTHKIRERHVISPKASRFLVERIQAALHDMATANQAQTDTNAVLG
ncbi:MAG TPA: alpha/beta hydrolase [Candidatus Saccharimonadales bacterium]|nr:alpha/beta hydrolase [Candidatus Saccharimonadales bacterium]